MKTSDIKPKGQKSIVIVRSNAANISGGEETEVAAQVTIPAETGWAWVVLLASFLMVVIIDGTAFTFGAMLSDVTKSLGVDVSMSALINAIQVATYFMGSPIASALINRFSFRTVAMMGSMICGTGLFATYFSVNFISVLLFYGIVTGLGQSFINMSASLIVGFYFEKNRSIAMAIASGGSSVGIMTMYPIHSKLTKLAGWKSVILMEAGIHSLVYFLGLTFRPLLSFTVTITEEEGNPTRTVTFLPTMSNEPGKQDGMKSTPTERMLGTVSNVHFPTAANIFQENTAAMSSQAGTSTSVKSSAVSKITLQAQNTASKKQLKQMQSMVSKIQMQDIKSRTEITVEAKQRKNKSCFGRLCDWEADVPESRPMYRDDAFYQGKVENLPVYQKSVAAIKDEDRTGLEYQLAVSRAITVGDLHDRRGVCTTAVRRVLVSMMDPSLLKRKSFMLFCFSGLFIYSGVLIPWVFLQDRNLQAGVPVEHCSVFVSVMSFSNLCGRFLFSALATKVEPVYLYAICVIIAGTSNFMSDISFAVPYQYGYCIMFGSFVSVISGLRGIVIVSLYGLENLTNATGVLLIFVGLGNLVSTPLAGILKKLFGYKYSFYASGGSIILGGLICLPVKPILNSENIQQAINKK